MIRLAIVLALVLPSTLAAQHAPVLRDVAYGAHEDQRFDVHLPDRPANAPIVVMAHGGGWRRGDKAMRSVILAKASRWNGRGMIVVSINYRMLPDVPPLEQARDVARAVAEVQRRAPSWGGDPTRVILAGHSAGGHLVALLGADPAMAEELGARRWLGTVVLDAGALDVTALMSARHMPLFDDAFGSDAREWPTVSPLHRLTRRASPMLVVCSSRRAVSCDQAGRFQSRAESLGVRAMVLEQDMTHREINASLGERGAYTDAVERFMATLDPVVATLLIGGTNR